MHKKYVSLTLYFSVALARIYVQSHPPSVRDYQGL